MPSVSKNPWIQVFKPNPAARWRLFCFPYAGGGASLFRPWVPEVPSEIELCVIQLPGRENRLTEPLLTALPAVVEQLTAALRPYLDRPFTFFGYSMGSLLSFEVARRLRRDGMAQPAHLHLAAYRAAHLPNREAPVRDLPEALFIERLRTLGGTPEAVLAHPELMQLLLPILRADFSICETYAYEAAAPLACPITALGGTQDWQISQAELGAWRSHTDGPFHLRMYPGGHFFYHDARSQVLRDVLGDLRPLLMAGI